MGDWLDYLIPELMKLRHEVMVNSCDKDCDVILTECRNQWELTKELHEKYPNIPLITWNWDWYDYIDKKTDNRMFGDAIAWREFTKLMKQSLEVWSSTKSEALKCEKETGIKSNFLFYAFILPWEWESESRDYGYIIQASRTDPNKRFDWYERATEELGIPYKSYHPHANSRPDYIRTVKNCSFSVLASREESLGGISSMEATYCKKPVLVSDNGGAKEIWGDTVNYFKRDDYEDFKKQMKWLWENYKTRKAQDKVERAYQRIIDRYLPHHFAEKIHNRLQLVL